MNYKDMTFCPYWKDCKSANMCHRPLTAKVQEDAKKFGLPVSMFASRPGCWSLKQPTDEPQEVVLCH